MKKIEVKDGEALALWYSRNKRDLPWRDTGNPYHIWLSEIMLQQTRIEAVKPKYLQFIAAVPDIPALAQLEDDRLMKLWEGLGYYSRARSLKKCAAVLCEKYQGRLPADYDALRKLPGIGPYTAGAIASIAWGIPVPAVDGNVLRVLARYSLDRRDVRSDEVRADAAQTIRDLFTENSAPGFVSAFNQGLMELGEVICIPRGTPACGRCPLAEHCEARIHSAISEVPCRSALKKRKIVHRTILVIRCGDTFLLHKRPDTGLLASLYEFIGVDDWIDEKEAVRQAENIGLEVLQIRTLPAAKHVFTHLEWQMKGYELRVSDFHDLKLKNSRFAEKKELAEDMAVPSAFRVYRKVCLE